jgi:hypothetical protein
VPPTVYLPILQPKIANPAAAMRIHATVFTWRGSLSCQASTWASLTVDNGAWKSFLIHWRFQRQEL